MFIFRITQDYGYGIYEAHIGSGDRAVTRKVSERKPAGSGRRPAGQIAGGNRPGSFGCFSAGYSVVSGRGIDGFQGFLHYRDADNNLAVSQKAAVTAGLLSGFCDGVRRYRLAPRVKISNQPPNAPRAFG